MYPRANQSPQSISLTTKKRSTSGMVPPPLGKERHPVTLVSSKQCSSRLSRWPRCSSGYAPFANKVWNNCLGSRSQTRPLKGQRPLFAFFWFCFSDLNGFLFFLLKIFWYKTRKSLLCLQSWARSKVNKVTSASLRYPLSVFNKNSTLKPPGSISTRVA